MFHSSILSGEWRRRITCLLPYVLLLLALTISGAVMPGCSSDDGGCAYTLAISNQPLCADLGAEFGCQEAFQDRDECLLENCICNADIDIPTATATPTPTSTPTDTPTL